jgi:hypothetical protein
MSSLTTDRPDKAHYGSILHETDENGLRLWNDAAGVWEPIVYVPFTYDVTGGDSGTVAAHPITGAVVPAGCIVMDGIVDVIETFTSAADTATIALHFEAAGDIVVAIAINDGSNPWDAGRQNIVPLGAAANAKKATAARTITATVAVQALTAGKLRGFLRCLRSTTS